MISTDSDQQQHPGISALLQLDFAFVSFLFQHETNPASFRNVFLPV